MDAQSDGGATIDAGCPQIFGAYAINNANGVCGDLADSAPQEIRGSVCSLQFISAGVDGGIGAINGSAPLGADGTFSGETLILGTMTRMPCSGSWERGRTGDHRRLRYRRRRMFDRASTNRAVKTSPVEPQKSAINAK
jgi:hypothetical protein